MTARRIDPVLLGAVLALTALGVVMVYSASAVGAAEHYGDAAYFLKRQVVAAAVGLLVMAVMVWVPPERLQGFAPLLLVLALGALVLVFVPGLAHTAGGATRWVRLGAFTFQPSELVKPAVILYLAWTLARKQDRMDRFTSGLLGPGLVVAVPVVIICAQPDLGTALTLVLLAGLMLFVAGARLTHLAAGALCAAPVVYFLIVGTPYRMRRILAFLDPWSLRQGAGYQVAESLISIGSGGLFGTGLGDGRHKLFFLPAARTDFIFSIAGEELGLVGALTIVALFAVLVWRGVAAAYAAQTPFAAYLALGLTATLGLQAVLNIAVATGLLPTTGLTLPFVSYGGTSLVLSFAAAGVLLAISGGQGGALDPGPGAPR